MTDELAALLQVFLAQSQEALDGAEEGLVRLETDPENAETLREVFRLIHTLKGDATSLGFGALGELSHTVEDLLDALREQRILVTHERVTLLLRALDALRVLLANAVQGDDGALPGQKELQEELTREAQAEESAEAPARIRANDQQLLAAAQQAAQAGRQQRTLRVDIERLDQLLTLTGEIAVARGRQTQLLEDERTRPADLQELDRETDRLYLDLQELVMKLRMVPVGPTFQQFRRTVRDLSESHGKEAYLSVEGGEVEIDNSVLQLLRDPLLHMVRNALDHGIETPDERERSGKDRAGSITLRAHHDAGNIVIEVSDDGSGLDHEAILDRARSRGLVPGDERPGRAELQQLIFEPGFSTSRQVTDLSGRGVGMDVVRRNIEALRGSVSIDSRAGRGTTLTVRLPLTLAIIEGLIVAVGDDTYVIPIDAVTETVELPPDAVERDDGRGVLELRDSSLPYVRLRQRFGIGGSPPPRENVVVLQHEAGRAGVVVDHIKGQSQTVIKPLAKVFQGVPGISASAILGNGRVALIMDVPGLLRSEIGDAEPGKTTERLGTC